MEKEQKNSTLKAAKNDAKPGFGAKMSTCDAANCKNRSSIDFIEEEKSCINETEIDENECVKSATDNQWATTALNNYPDERDRRDGPGGEARS